MRVMPIALGLIRTAAKDMVIGGYQVPSGVSGRLTNIKYPNIRGSHLLDDEILARTLC